MISIKCNCNSCNKLITDAAYGDGVVVAKTYCHTCYIELINKIKELEEEIKGFKSYFLQEE